MQSAVLSSVPTTIYSKPLVHKAMGDLCWFYRMYPLSHPPGALPSVRDGIDVALRYPTYCTADAGYRHLQELHGSTHLILFNYGPAPATH